MRRWFGVTLLPILLVCALASTTVRAQGAWRGFILVDFTGWPDGLNLAQQAQVLNAFVLLCPTTDEQPQNNLQYRWDLAYTAVFIECEYPVLPDAAAIVTALASQLGYIEPYIAANVAIEPFAPGEAWEVSAEAVRTYLAAHREAWEAVVYP